MKLMITWQMHEGKLHETLAQFSKMTEAQELALSNNKIKLIGRWHDLVRGQGVAIYETDDASAFSK